MHRFPSKIYVSSINNRKKFQWLQAFQMRASLGGVCLFWTSFPMVTKQVSFQTTFNCILWSHFHWEKTHTRTGMAYKKRFICIITTTIKKSAVHYVPVLFWRKHSRSARDRWVYCACEYVFVSFVAVFHLCFVCWFVDTATFIKFATHMPHSVFLLSIDMSSNCIISIFSTS